MGSFILKTFLLFLILHYVADAAPNNKDCAKSCGQNEEYLKCGCRKFCEGADPDCNKKNCKEGCFCKNGFVRKGNKCIRPNQCNAGCKENEAYRECGVNPTCANPKPVSKAPNCKSGCFCKDGFVSRNNKCVPVKECQPEKPTCGPNEVFKSCACRKHCDGKDKQCHMANCKSGCFCKDGFVRINGKCIDKCDCGSHCGKNEVYKQCGCNVTCQGRDPNCNKCNCKPGCYCASGYVLKNDKCIKETDCDPECGENEQYLECGCRSSCDGVDKSCNKSNCKAGCFCKSGYVRKGNKCISRDSCDEGCGKNERYTECGCKETCQGVDPNCNKSTCQPGCFCKKGYVLKKNECILEKTCDAECGENEEYLDCGCRKNCEGQDPDCNLSNCKAGCFCKEGFVWKGNKCIPKDKCDAECKENERYRECGCRTTCQGPDQDCNKSNCQPGCFCKPGYVWKKDSCILETLCDAECGENEEYMDCGCRRTCDGPDPNCNKWNCKCGCFCKEGYVKKDNKCILAKDCDEGCGENEKYKECGCKETCQGTDPECNKNTCESGCFCKPGYVLKRNKCIKEPECDAECDENEEYLECGCTSTCDGVDPKCNRSNCKAGCFCKHGFVKKCGKCVPKDTCDAECGKNEMYKECGCRETCQGRDDLCCPENCKPGCYCKPGYVYKRGECVLESDCDAECGPNEEYMECGCRRNCDGQDPDCNASTCKSGCFCKDGYVRKCNKCIPKAECDAECGENERYRECGCQETCQGMDPLCRNKCKSGCFCKPGYVRKRNKCILESECDAECAENEEYLDCGCRSTCDGPDPNCNLSTCKAGCFCKEGYVWKQNKCVKATDCDAECGENEKYTDCGCRETCQGKDLNCNRDNCKHGCFCKKGYVWKRGKCTLETECDAECGANEEYMECGCMRTCDGQDPECDDSNCKAGCFCKEGFVRKDNRCIPKDDCDAGCGENEKYTECGCLSNCQGRDPKCSKQNCKKGCFCKPGYVRKRGQCIKEGDCNAECGENEEYLECGCKRNCDGADPNCNNSNCESGCFCKNGYVRKGTKCIPAKDCDIGCGENEKYRECGCRSTCQGEDRTCNKNNCKPGCYCQPGYVYKKGQCILETKCDAECGANEKYLDCGCNRSCDGPDPQCDESNCHAGCFCKDGYVKKGNKCIPTDKCDEGCAENERYTECGCRATCQGVDRKCNKSNCKSGCFCKPGYVYKRGKCILEGDCNAECGANEEYLDCGCRRDCDGVDPECNETNCKCGCFCKEGFVRKCNKCIPAKECDDGCSENQRYTECGCFSNCQGKDRNCHKGNCKSGCFCKPGYVLKKGKCILETDCNAECNANEEYLDCGCVKTCDGMDAECNAATCVPGCFCKEGYVRKNNRCIPQNECDAECGENERYTECGCKETCQGVDRSCNKSNCKCGCFCKPGYVLKRGKCILKSDCDKECGANEEYVECGCRRSCDGEDPDCSVVNCRDGCFCKEGFVRKCNKCIPANECDAECGENEKYRECGCKETCQGVDRSCNKSTCKAGCYCKKDYVMKRGKCIPRTECDAECGANETYLECGCRKTCDGADPNCNESNCKSGCFCKEGYVRKCNKCVPDSECDVECGENEKYTECGCRKSCQGVDRSCNPDNCKSGCFCKPGYVSKRGKCILRTECNAECRANEEYQDCGCQHTCDGPDPDCNMNNCKSGCFCKDGYVLKCNKCIPKEECDAGCGENEKYRECGCKETCQGVDRSCNKSNCKPGCYCKDGYVLKKGKCILETKCDAECGPNEEYLDCGCRKNCDGRDPDCNEGNCKSGCFCKEGYVRKCNKCIPEKDCNVGCGENEVYRECGCKETCQGTDPNCNKNTCKSGCFCKNNYVLKKGKCIPEPECDAECGENEEYLECGCRRNCDGQDPKCNRMNCKAGCFCKDGFVTKNNKCIKKSECDKGCKENERYTECGCKETCQGKDSNCNKCNCKPGCFCKPDYVLKRGECVLEKDCDAECGENEEYLECGCRKTCDGRDPNCNKNTCKSGCFCKEGFVKKNNKCIPESDCNVGCGANEKYTECGCKQSCQGVDRSCNKSNCKAGCFCRPGYVLKRGQCIKESECNAECGPNEEYFDCECRKTCDGTDPKCNLSTCKAGCFCKHGYVRKGTKCIPQCDCDVGCGENEKYRECGCRETCQGKDLNCNKENCKPGCYCKEGYVWKKGGCVLETQCDAECGANEEYLECGCNSNCEGPDPNCNSVTCHAGCFCKEGFVRKNNKCIKKSDCDADCGENETYKECGCKETCQGKDPNCNKDNCKQGCFCKSGYVYKRGKCIKEPDCDAECGENEEYLDCGCTRTCDGNDPDCNMSCCKPGCFCKNGYVKKGNKCVPECDCDAGCGENEKYKECGCRETCQGPDRYCNKDNCKPGCYCKKGFVWKKGECIAEDKCDAECGANEEYLECGCNRDCDGEDLTCNTGNCKSGCFCKEGYVRKDNRCIPKDECDAGCGSNEKYTECGCKRTCQGEDRNCNKSNCKKGCFCKPKYVWKIDKCILESECDAGCGPNEKYLDCGCNSNCDGNDPDCNMSNCKCGCFCKEGYVRKGNKCIPKCDCDVGCGENEKYKECGCRETCQGKDRNCNKNNCKPGCYCKSGYVWKKNQCIKEGDCDAECGANEEYLECGCGRTCDGDDPNCNESSCKAGCFCKEGFVRKDGKCIETKDCDVGCGENEKYTECGCMSTCQGVDRNCNKSNCKRGCFCMKGYVMKRGKCIKEGDCNAECGANEEYLECGCKRDCDGDDPNCNMSNCTPGCFCKVGFVRKCNKCVAESTCDDECGANEEYRECGCRETCQGKDPNCNKDNCKPGCYCKRGYVYKKGQCVLETTCDAECGANEEYLECGCRKTCDGPDPECNMGNCKAGCFCKDKYVKKGDKCILQTQCDEGCGENEKYTECGCRETCQGKDPNCNKNTCKQGCFCKKGFVLKRNKCIAETTCNSDCGANEVYLECGCRKTCDGKDPDCNDSNCKAGCFCKEGFVRKCNKCVEESKCNEDCGENQVYRECGCIETCQGKDPNCNKSNCKSGCFCKPGYVSNRNKCILDDDCPPECGANEEYTECGCRKECDNRDMVCDKDKCKKGCFCKEGFVWKRNKCIPDSDCDMQCGKNQVYRERGCQTTCSNRDPHFCRRPRPGCYCKDGYVYKDGECVPVKECEMECGENKEYRDCGCSGTCKKKSPMCDAPYCKGGCFCKEGYYLIGNKCIRECDCEYDDDEGSEPKPEKEKPKKSDDDSCETSEKSEKSKETKEKSEDSSKKSKESNNKSEECEESSEKSEESSEKSKESSDECAEETEKSVVKEKSSEDCNETAEESEWSNEKSREKEEDWEHEDTSEGCDE